MLRFFIHKINPAVHESTTKKPGIRKSIEVSVALLCLGSTFFFLTENQVLAGPHKVLLPKIFFPETVFDFGIADEGVQLKHSFKVQNQGEKDLLIKTAFSTCGCTIPQLKKKRIAPGETVDLDVVMDTSMKQGDVSKPIEVRSTDPVNPVVTIHIKAKIKSPHGELGSDRTAKIFTGRCAACHVQQGIGKEGQDLFEADCAMCHGYRAKGIPSVAPPLIPFDYHDKDFAESMKKIISEGSKIHRSMPGYAKSAGGPLEEKEIDSIVDYLRKKSDFELKPH
ncbi:MAG: DUF1573 domain-containing protein [Candidatus Obscuribacterales bacterium]|nr:DUF1573 domain-containing protein [Candidatus Obscuribacterales bacterium]